MRDAPIFDLTLVLPSLAAVTLHKAGDSAGSQLAADPVQFQPTSEICATPPLLRPSAQKSSYAASFGTSIQRNTPRGCGVAALTSMRTSAPFFISTSRPGAPSRYATSRLNKGS